jgi:hypothetical protein
LKKYFLIQRLQQAKNKENQGQVSLPSASVTTSVPTTDLSHTSTSTAVMSSTALPTAGLTSASLPVAVSSSAAAFAASQTSTILTTASPEVHLSSVVLVTASSTEPSVSVTNTNSPSPAIVTGVQNPTAPSPLPTSVPTLDKTSGFTSADHPPAFHSTLTNLSASADAPPASELAASQTALPLVEVDGALLLVEPENTADQSSSLELEGTNLITPEPSLAKLLAHEEQLQN